MSETLLPCPFCGQEPYLLNHSNNPDNPMWYMVCANWHCCCPKTESYDDQDEIINLWNKRVTPELPLGDI